MCKTCYDLLLKGVNKNGFLVYYGHKIPMRRFLGDIDCFAAALVALGLKKGDVVTVYLPSCPQSLAAFYACSKVGLIANIVHPKIPLRLLEKNLQKVHSKVLLFYDVLVRNERELSALGQILVRCSIADYETFRKPLFAAYSRVIGKRLRGISTFDQMRRNKTVVAVTGKKDDIVCYMHSGGTGGEPKIVRLTNGAFNGTAFSMVEMYKPTIKDGDVNLATLPVFHAYGLCAGMHTPLYLGCNLILMPKFNPKTVRRYFSKYRITIWSVVPAMLKKMERMDCSDFKGLRSLDVIWCGGDVLDEAMVEKTDSVLKKYCPRARLMRGYGLTETCGVCAVNNYFYYKKYSCGKPMPGCFAQIWDENQNPLPVGQKGEVVISSPGITAGYLESDDSVGCVVEADGKKWVKTGDIGYLDEDGFLYIADRIKRTLKIAAVNVFPSQTENCIRTLLFVDEVCVVGVKVEGKQFLKAFVTLKTAISADEAEKQIKNICRENLIPYSVPQFVEIIDEMPHTAIGKVDFKALESRSLS